MEKLSVNDLRQIFTEARLNPNHRGGTGTPSRKAAKIDGPRGFTIRDPNSRKNRKRRYEAMRAAQKAGPTTEQRRRQTLNVVARDFALVPAQQGEQVA